MVDADGETIDYAMNSPFVYFRSLVQDLSPPETGKVVRNRSAKVHKFPGNRQQALLSGFCLYSGVLLGKSEYFGHFVGPEVIQIDVERFESLY
jgi:hypothetical protein